MKHGVKRKIGWLVALAVTIFVCDVSARLYEMSIYSLAFGRGPEPASFNQLFRYAAYLDTPSSLDSCINRLRQIDGAKQQWGIEHGKKETDNVTVTWKDIEPYLAHQERVWCTRGGVYRLGTLAEPPTCSVKGHALP